MRCKLDGSTPKTWMLGVLCCILLAIVLNGIYLLSAWGIRSTELGIIRVGILFVILMFLFLHFVFSAEKIYDYIYNHRFLLAAVLFAACVLLKLHGSSIGVWNNYIVSSSEPSVYQNPILGIPRPIRSDEWNVFTPLAMSQYFNGYGIQNNIACAWPTNMLTTYNQPVWDITVIAKPFYWGYLLLGSEYGLSWFWSGRLIALFLVTFEMFMLITRQSKKYALAASFLITFSSVVQWWFAINFFVEMLIWGQLAELMIFRFLNTDSRKQKWACSVTFALCGLGYIFALYPVWMIPLFYLFAALAVWILIENFNKMKHSWKEVIYPLFSMLIIAVVALYWLMVSKDAISATMNTAYPGARVYTGGDESGVLFRYINNLFLPYRNVMNSCEAAMAYGFFPFTELIVIIYLCKTKCQDKLLTILAVLDVFFLTFFLCGFPEKVAKITLLYLTTYRIGIIICIIEIIMFLRLLSLSDKPLLQKKRGKITFFVLFGILAALFLWEARKRIPLEINPEEGLRIRYLLVMALIILGYCAYFLIDRTDRKKTVFTISVVVISTITGMFVNPLMRTTDAIYDKPLASAVQTIQKEDPGIWISSNCIYSNFLISNGAPAVNSVNIIPVLDRWNMFDEGQENAEVYNRYAHIHVGFIEDGVRFEMGTNADWFTVYVDVDALRKMNVKYICAPINQNFPADQYDNVLTQIYSDGRLAIFKTNFTEEGDLPE